MHSPKTSPLNETLLPETVISCRPLQARKALSPIFKTLSGRTSSCRDVQDEKAACPMVSTDSGRMASVRLVHPLKA